MIEPRVDIVTIDGRPHYLDVERGRVFPVIRGGDGPTPDPDAPAPDAPAEGDAPAPEAEPDDPNAVVLTELSDDDLTAAEETLNTQFAAIFDAEGDPTAEQVAQMAELAEQIEAVRAEGLRRAEEADANRLAAEEIAARVRPPVEETPADVVTPEPEAVLVTAAATVPAEDVLPAPRRRLNLSLAEIRARAPEVVIDTPRPSHRTVITAAADIAGFASGAEFPDAQAIAKAFQSKARSMATGKLGTEAARAPVVQIQREHAITIGEEITDEQMAQIMERVTDVQSLVAAGGWCAPSSILYDLFNISSDDGMVDLPTVGVTRGGIKFPTSPALADFLASIWLWTEADDILAATGTGTKPCVRVPCPAFTDVRMEAHGLCVTAGMLTDASYPEATVNFVKLLMDAHRHVMNARHLAQMEAASSALTLLSPADGATANLLAGVDLAAVDTREKFGMAEDSVLEVVMPRWNKGVARSDLARRQGVDNMLAITDAQLGEWFDVRNVRVQFVADWQTRGVGAPGTATPGVTAPLTAWPTTSKFLIYPAGTFVLGEGPTIDAGSIRDSVLNSKNDFTAAWTEEASLVAKLGHESRVYTVKVCPDGVTGAGVNAECPAA